MLSTEWDDLARRIGAMGAGAFGRLLNDATEADQSELLRLRWRWQRPEFAELCIRPMIERRSRWFPVSAFHAEVLRAHEHYALRAPANRQELIAGARGLSKTTTAKIAAYAAALYGLESGILAYGKNDTEAVGWTSTVRAWIEEPSPLIRRCWPDLGVDGNRNELKIHAAGTSIALHARGWTSASRGINDETARPSLVMLDDVEVEENTRSDSAREGFAEKLNGAILNVGPPEGGLYARWLATPAHHNAAVARAIRREEDMAAWDVLAFPLVQAWPHNAALWDRARAIYMDLDRYGTAKERRRAVLAFYDAHRFEMDDGAAVVDPHRRPIVECQILRWDRGPAAFAREFQVDPRAGADTVFVSDTFARHREDGDELITAGGKRINWRSLPGACFWDPADSGKDDGAIVTGVGEPNGRTFLLDTLTTDKKISAQAQMLVSACRRRGIRTAHVESNQLPSTLVDALRIECDRQGWALTVVKVVSSENKNARINSIEPACCDGLISFPSTMTPAQARTWDDYDPGRSDNRDDLEDATQRVHQILHMGGAGWATESIGI